MSFSIIFIPLMALQSYLLVPTFAAENLQYHTVLENEKSVLTCVSKEQVPVWIWYGKTDHLATTLAMGVKKHKRFTNER